MLFVLIAIIELGVLIMIHEGGHFLVARLSGMKVERFSIGFGPALLKFKRGETTYQLSAIPLGGFVQIAGLNPGEEAHVLEDPRAFPNRPVWQRLLTIFAGPGTNYLFAALLMALIFVGFGVPVAGKIPVVDQLVEGKPAAAAGIQLEDEILSINGQAMSDVNDVAPLIDKSGGKPVTVVVRRDGKQLPSPITVTPVKDGERYRIGIGLGVTTVRERQPFGASLVAGLVWPWEMTKMQLKGFADIFRGKQKAEFSGPIGIVKVMKKRIAMGPDYALEIMAFISVLLGLFNLLPLPALDGGRLAFLAAEAVSRRRINQRVEGMVHMVGMLVLMGFLLYVTVFHDGPRIFK